MTREYRGAETEAKRGAQRQSEAEVEKVKRTDVQLERATGSFLKEWMKLKRNRNQTESLILAQDERWRRA